MFRRPDNLIVTQAEHSRLSGELALLLGDSLGISVNRIAGAIALHDWPHFGGAHADTIEIGKKTSDQQRQLVERLSGPLPLDSFTELVVRLHWQRLSDDADLELQSAINQDRITQLMSDHGLANSTAKALDGWTDLCDALAFYLSRGASSAGDFQLQEPFGSSVWNLSWKTSPDTIAVAGVPNPMDSRIGLVAYESDDYPHRLRPEMRSITCKFGQ